MAAVFGAMVVVAGAGVAVASGLATYAQRHWRKDGRAAVTDSVDA